MAEQTRGLGAPPKEHGTLGGATTKKQSTRLFRPNTPVFVRGQQRMTWTTKPLTQRLHQEGRV